MSDRTLLAHLVAIDASLELLRVQVAGMRHHLETREREAEAINGAQLDIPARCAGIEPRACAIQHDENRIDVSGFGCPTRWKCLACDYDSLGASHAGGE